MIVHRHDLERLAPHDKEHSLVGISGYLFDPEKRQQVQLKRLYDKGARENL